VHLGWRADFRAGGVDSKNKSENDSKENFEKGTKS
jgi:hypothetical protein